MIPRKPPILPLALVLVVALAGWPGPASGVKAHAASLDDAATAETRTDSTPDLSAPKWPAWEREKVTLAVLAVGAKKVPAGWVELLEPALTEGGAVELVERAKIRRVLEEQALSLSGLVKESAMVGAGKLIGADGFVLFDEIRRDKESFIRVRLVETRLGIRLWEMILPPGSMPDEIVDHIAGIITREAKSFQIDPENMRLVGILGFRCDDISRRYE